jgi:hypothetical protein
MERLYKGSWNKFLGNIMWRIFVAHMIVSIVFFSYTMPDYNPIVNTYNYFFVYESCKYGSEYCEKTEILFKIKYFLVLFCLAQIPIVTIFLARMDSAISIKVFIVLCNISPVYLVYQNMDYHFYTIDQDCVEILSGFESCIAILKFSWKKLANFIGKIYLVTPFSAWVILILVRKIRHI